MNAKLLTDEALRDDLYIEMMHTAGVIGYYKLHPEQLMQMDVRDFIDDQLDMLMPVVKRHIKRRVKVAKGQL